MQIHFQKKIKSNPSRQMSHYSMKTIWNGCDLVQSIFRR